MAPSRKTGRATKQAGSRKRKARAPDRSLFFGGTELVQEDAEDDGSGDEEREQEQSYVEESDADENEDDDVYEETSTTARKRQAKKKTSKKSAAKTTESDYDSEDKFIIDLKKQGYKDDAVAKKLVTEGYQEFSAKRIQARWLRLKKVVEQKEEERLDDELSDWHIGEDEKLRAYFSTMEARYEVELLRLKERKWKDIATALAESLSVKKYTPKACKERWESLEDGTALIPIELADDTEARHVLREARVAENKRRRAEQRAAVIWTLGEKDRKAAERRALMEEKEKERQAERARKQAERDEDERIKAEQRAGLEEKRAKQRAISDAIKEHHQAKRRERKNADAMYTYYTGKKLNGRRDNSLIKTPNDETTYSDSDIEMEGSLFDDDEQEPDMPHITDAEESSNGESANEIEASETSRRFASVTNKTKSKHVLRSKKPKVTLETLVNPRSIMNDAELAAILTRRKLRRRTTDETHAEVVARIAAADAEETVPKLRELLAGYFERRKGTHDVLVRRLQEYDAARSILGEQGVTAIDPEFKKGYEGYRGKFAYAIQE